MLIRKLQQEDKEQIRTILEGTVVFTKEEIDVAVELMEIFLEDQDQHDYDMYTAVEQENDVLGFVCMGATPLTEGTFDLYWIAVKSSHHHRGIGKQLLEHAEGVVRSNGGRLLIAETSSQPKYDNTRSFYIKNHYQEVARIKNYYKQDDDLVIYGKYLSQPQEEHK